MSNTTPPEITGDKEKDFKNAIEYFIQRVKGGTIRSVRTYMYYVELLETYYPEEHVEES